MLHHQQCCKYGNIDIPSVIHINICGQYFIINYWYECCCIVFHIVVYTKTQWYVDPCSIDQYQKLATKSANPTMSWYDATKPTTWRYGYDDCNSKMDHWLNWTLYIIEIFCWILHTICIYKQWLIINRE